MLSEIEYMNEHQLRRVVERQDRELKQLRNDERERIYLQILEAPTVLVTLPATLHEIIFGE
jgi:hypothetical protein